MTPADAAFMVKLREHGRRPAAAFLLDYPGGDWTVEQQVRAGALPAFHVEHLDPEAADLRFLVGVPVHLHCDKARAAAWVCRLLAFGAGPIYQLTQGEVTVWRPS